MRIDSLPLPEKLSSLLISQGYSELYPPQEEAVRAGALERENLVISTPTASGKTLIAIMAAGKMVLEEGAKVVYLTPLRALANEKYDELKTLETLQKHSGKNIRVAISTGDYDSSGESLGKADIIVLTNEKFDSVLRHGASWIGEVGLFVSDEAHLVGDDHRGPTLEVILTKILAFAQRSQLLALSATITNAKELSSWLKGKTVNSDWRPVPLLEGIYDYGKVDFTNGSSRQIEQSGRGIAVDIAAEAVKGGGQALIFAETRRRAVSLAEKASEITGRLTTREEEFLLSKASEEIMRSGEETTLSISLARSVRKGSAFHHAGLASHHRRIVENYFRRGAVKILTSTPTLAAGVNLPARRVVIASMMRYDSEYGGQTPISVLDYKQMSGRAGRPKYDKVGEIVLIASGNASVSDLEDVYIKGRPEPIRSRLIEGGALRSHVLATIASLPGLKEEDVHNFFSKTLLAQQYRPSTVRAKLEATLDYLESEDLVRRKGARLIATDFGRRIAMLYIDPETGVLFRNALKGMKEEEKKVQLGLLHLVTICNDFAPKFNLRNKDWEDATEFIKQHEQEFILPVPKEDSIEFYESFTEYFRSVLILYAWIEESSEETILEKFSVEPGDLHRAVENAEWLLYSLHEIAQVLRRRDILPQVQVLRERIRYGIREELLPLTTLDNVGRVRARSLFRSGFKTLRDLEHSEFEELARIPKIGYAVANSIKRQLGQETGYAETQQQTLG